jgi:hypothetical protein
MGDAALFSQRNFRVEPWRRPALVLGLGAAALLMVGLPLSQSQFVRNVATLPTTKSPTKDFLASLTERSPGKRTQAELNKTKHKLAVTKPHQRALAKINKPKETPPAFVQALTGTPSLLVDALPSISVPPPVQIAEAATPRPLGRASIPPGSGIVVPFGGGAGGGGGGGGGGEPDSTPPSETPAVPEPATWAMMLLGFGMTGWMLRRRPITRRPRACASS